MEPQPSLWQPHDVESWPALIQNELSIFMVERLAISRGADELTVRFERFCCDEGGVELDRGGGGGGMLGELRMRWRGRHKGTLKRGSES